MLGQKLLAAGRAEFDVACMKAGVTSRQVLVLGLGAGGRIGELYVRPKQAARCGGP